METDDPEEGDYLYLIDQTYKEKINIRTFYQACIGEVGLEKAKRIYEEYEKILEFSSNINREE